MRSAIPALLLFAACQAPRDVGRYDAELEPIRGLMDALYDVRAETEVRASEVAAALEDVDARAAALATEEAALARIAARVADLEARVESDTTRQAELEEELQSLSRERRARRAQLDARKAELDAERTLLLERQEIYEQLIEERLRQDALFEEARTGSRTTDRN